MQTINPRLGRSLSGYSSPYRSYNPAGIQHAHIKGTLPSPSPTPPSITARPVLTTANPMNAVQSTHQFADAATARIQGLRSEHCQLVIRQKPEIAKVAVGKEKDRKPVDPPPIIQLKISSQSDPAQNYLQSPYFFMSCSLVGAPEKGVPSGPLGTALAGTLVSSLHRLKDQSNNDGAFFVFGDLSIKIEGTFRLQFNLYEMRDKECFHIQSTQSEPFIVHPQKTFPGMAESTFLTRSFSDQGVRLRLRKEPRTLVKKRGQGSDEYESRYRASQQTNRQPSYTMERTGPEIQDPARQTQPEHAEQMQLPIHQGHPYEQHRVPLGRGYSHHSQPSSISMGSYSDEAPNKRPRTGSEHSSNYSQQFSPQEPFAPSRIYEQPNYGNTFPQQQQVGGYAYTFQSPVSSSMSSRDLYFSQRLNTQAGNSPSFETNSQRSPNSANFPPQQPQAIRYQQPPLLSISPTQRGNQNSSFDQYAISPRAQVAAGLQPISMAPPTYSRMNTSPTAYGPISPLTSVGRRDYGSGSYSNPMMPGSTLDSNLMTSTSHIAATSAPVQGQLHIQTTRGLESPHY
ncbi:hypothetical protein HYALB_00003468 [Hymenoscyphus albidus]|uniref:Velvet domain-containing protein n=1 Tax=Hymenoscyphus albidus TaxID=595503 RepID=A0A9N9LPC2_9HELO|nr:hypothetical protein HYALB_00003468 [Hymenoscyphus albidus]